MNYMALLEIKKFNAPVLRKEAKKVEKVDKKVKSLVLNMIQTMKNGQGIGLAAPQVGISERVIVVMSNFKNG